MPVRAFPDSDRSQMEIEVRRRWSSSIYRSLLGESPLIGSPIPTFFLRYSEVLSGHGPADAEMIGLRYLTLGGPNPGLIMMHRDEQGRIQYGGLMFGRMPQQLMVAAAQLDATISASPATFEPRLLEVPSLRFSCLWLASDAEDLFFTLSETQRMSMQRFVGMAELMERLATLVVETEAKRAFSQPDSTE